MNSAVPLCLIVFLQLSKTVSEYVGAGETHHCSSTNRQGETYDI